MIEYILQERDENLKICKYVKKRFPDCEMLFCVV